MTTSQAIEKKRRILTISKPYVAATYRDKLQAWQAAGRYEIGLICPPAWDGQAFEPSVADDKIWIRQVPIWADGHNHFHLYRSLRAAIDAFKPDLLHIEEEHYSLVTWQALRHAKRRSIPATFYTWQNIDKVYPPPFCWIEKMAFARAQAIAGNQEAAEILRRKGYVKDVAVIPQMGVDMQRFATADLKKSKQTAKAKLGWSADQIWLGYLGRLVPEKAVDLLIRALASLPPHYRLCIFGDGPEHERLLALARELAVETRIVMRRRVPSTEVADILLALDLLALPSLTTAGWKEQFGRVLIEAMAAGTATVGSDSGEIPHVIGDAGWVLPENNLAAWTHSLAGMTSEDLAARGEVGRRRVESLYTNEVIAQKFLAVFDDLLGP